MTPIEIGVTRSKVKVTVKISVKIKALFGGICLRPRSSCKFYITIILLSVSDYVLNIKVKTYKYGIQTKSCYFP